MIKYTESKLVLTNISRLGVKVFGKAVIPNGKTLDMFKTIPGLTESSVIEALRSPDGELYQKVYVLRELKIDEMQLAHFANSAVEVSNLVATGTPGKDKYLTIDEAGSLYWRHINVEDRIKYHTPLIKESENISIAKAGPNSNGYLSREDWLLFKGRHAGFRIWQYQDFDKVGEVALTLTQFQNGNTKFEESWVVDGSAAIVSIGSDKPPRTGFFGQTVRVTQHIGKDLILSAVPSSRYPCRVWFLVSMPVGTAIPAAYIQPPRSVRNSRVDFLDLFDIDAPGDKQILGTKTFAGDAHFLKSIKIDGNVSGVKSFVAKTITVEDGAATGYSLVSNSVGNAEWRPVPSVGSQPPNNAYSGQLWVKEPDFSLYVFDGQRSKWLSTNERFICGGLNTTVATNTYLRTDDNVSMQTAGECLATPSCLIGLIATSQSNDSWKAEVHMDGRAVPGAEIHVVGGKAFSTSCNVNFPAGASIQLFVNGEHVAMPKVQAVFKSLY